MSASQRNLDLTLRCVKAVLDMHFVEFGYGSPDDATMLAVKITDHLDNEGRIR